MAFVDGSVSGAGAGRDFSEEAAEAGFAFKFCPSCSSPRLRFDKGRMWVCPDCGFEYFHNVATAAGIIIEVDSGVVLLRRAREPRRGMLGLPGGFIEPGESAEAGALRECGEELGWLPDSIEFLASYPNMYRYRGIPYATCDLYFCARASAADIGKFRPDAEEVAEIRHFPVNAIPWSEIAFASLRRALRKYVGSRGIEIPLGLAEEEGAE